MHADFETILNWRLLTGSHPFPGPDGGTCINEAAIVAAGLPYRAIRSSADCPPCFSRPVAAYALGLNDAMPDEARPQLMAFVLRLSGSADTPEIEAARTRRLALESIRRILAPLCQIAGMAEEAEACAAAPDLPAARAAATAAAWRGGALSQAAAQARRWREGARPPRSPERPRRRSGPARMRAAPRRSPRGRPRSCPAPGARPAPFSRLPSRSAAKRPRSPSPEPKRASTRPARWPPPDQAAAGAASRSSAMEPQFSRNVPVRW